MWGFQGPVSTSRVYGHYGTSVRLCWTCGVAAIEGEDEDEGLADEIIYERHLEQTFE